MKNRYFSLGLIAGVLAFTACQTVPKLSPQQRRQLQTRAFKDVGYNNVFRAFKTVLQDEGYIIKNQDMKGGLIVAHLQQTSSAFGAFTAGLSGTNHYKTGTTYEVSVNLDPIRKNYTEARVIIQKLDSYSMGGTTGREVLSPELYRNILNKVMTEVTRRQAMGK